MRRLLVAAAVVLAMVGSALVAEAAPSDAGLNARLIRWQEQDATVHILVYDDVGRNGTTATVPEGRPLLFGFEFADADRVALEAALVDITMRLSVDGAASVDVTDAFLEIFYSDGRGPRWTWDHDADGRGDRDGDGIGDTWVGLHVAPFRYAHPGMAAGPHTFTFSLDYGDGSPPFDDTVSFEMIP